MDEETTPRESRTGVYLCHCGGNISDVVDVKAAGGMAAEHPGVAVVRDYPFMCSAPGQDLIIEDLRNDRVDRVVVAACSPALHELTFRRALEKAGVNPYLYEHVNIREGASWVHKSDHDGATKKAAVLISAGVEKVRRQEPLEPLRVKAEHRVVVLGAGLAGLTTALALAGKGFEVCVVEKEREPGGHLRTLGAVYPTGEAAAELLGNLLAEVRGKKEINLRCGAEVTAVDGYVGSFTVKVLHGDGTAEELRAGAVVLATGFSPYLPSAGELGYGSERVLTLAEFTSLLDGQPREGPLMVKGRHVKSLAFIHCVGSRQVEGVHEPREDGKLNDYCSRVCCTSALHTLDRLLEGRPGLQVYDLYRDIRTYGRGHEKYYEAASRKGVLFFRLADDAPPEVLAAEDGTYRLKVRDLLTWGEEVEIRTDAVVLVTGMMPAPIPAVAESLKLPMGSDRFIQEAHPKLRPVEIASAGIFLAGTCQGPMDLCESAAAAGAAAAKVAILLTGPEISLDPFVAEVDAARCDGCGLCLGECSYEGALELSEGKAKVNAALCKGCGACGAVCEPRAIRLAGWTLDQFDAMVDAVAGKGA